MGDPFSVAGSAVGVISLGLQACHGLASYINKYKSADKEMRDVKCRVEGLESILQGLRDILTGAGRIDPPLAGKFKVALRMITDCESAIQELDNTSSKLRNNPSQAAQGVFPALKTASKRALYPFRRDALVGLLSVLGGLQENLDTALALLQIILNLDSKTRVVSIQQSTIDIVANTSQTLTLAQGIEQRHHDMDQILSRLDQRMEQMQSTISHYSTRNLPEPSTLRYLCDKQKKVDHDMNHFVMDLQPRENRIKKACFCVASVGFLSVITHKPGCPHFIPYQTVKTIQSRYRICNNFLRYSIYASLRITTGAGGFAISPHIAFHAVVRDSPAFTLVEDHCSRVVSELYRWQGKGDPINRYGPQDFMDLRVKLLRLYQEGKASPTDVNIGGQTIFHYLALFIGLTLYSENETIIQSGRRLLTDLISSVTLPTTVDNDGRTVADCLSVGISQYHNSIDLIRDAMMPRHWMDCFALIMDRGGYLTHSTFDDEDLHSPAGAVSNAIRFELANQVMKYTRNGDCNVPEILEPLMLRDEGLLRSLVETPSFVSCSEIPYPYIYWPEGLRILLRSGKLHAEYSLQLACAAHVPESVVILLSSRWFCIQSTHLQSAIWGHDPEIMKLIVNALVEERRELQILAESHLSSEEFASLHLKSDTLLDFHAGKAYDLLQAIGLRLPDWEVGWRQWLVYASIRNDCEMADLLWHGGFKDVDEANNQRCTSLMFCSDFRFADWLISHGADIHRRAWGIPALHLMAGKSGFDFSKLSSLDEPSLRTFNLLLQDESQDECDCPCSLAGCFAITHWLCDVLRYRRNDLSPMQSASIISDLVRQLGENVPLQAALAIIRVLTFQVLRIPHTCCHPRECWGLGDCDCPHDTSPYYHWEPKEREEIEEIHDEWREQIGQLEALMTRFQTMYETSNLSFCRFLKSIWCEEMNELDNKVDYPNQEEARRVRELGVILAEREEDSSQDEADEGG